MRYLITYLCASAHLSPFTSCSEDTLRLHFEQFGSLENAEVMKDRYTGKSRLVCHALDC
jgi:RNA recognition motif-containing protein